MSHDPTYVQPRKPLTTKEKLEVYLAAGGRCQKCHAKITIKQMIDEHLLPLWLGQKDGPDLNARENRKCFCGECAQEKTNKESTERAKGRRVAKKHTTPGKITKTKPLPFGRNSKLKKKFNGKVVPR